MIQVKTIRKSFKTRLWTVETCWKQHLLNISFISVELVVVVGELIFVVDLPPFFSWDCFFIFSPQNCTPKALKKIGKYQDPFFLPHVCNPFFLSKLGNCGWALTLAFCSATAHLSTNWGDKDSRHWKTLWGARESSKSHGLVDGADWETCFL